MNGTVLYAFGRSNCVGVPIRAICTTESDRTEKRYRGWRLGMDRGHSRSTAEAALTVQAQARDGSVAVRSVGPLLPCFA